ncbi:MULTISPECIES: hypothetical protein [unclassified Streptomyces]|uniref:hypothetical protein n=1 Tax=unclassified Streptomyces TaxID=2593676 RepID=UPI0035E1A1A4
MLPGGAVPTFETLPRLTTDLDRLTPAQHQRFRRAVLEAFVPDLHTGRRFHPGSAPRASAPLRASTS